MKKQILLSVILFNCFAWLIDLPLEAQTRTYRDGTPVKTMLQVEEKRQPRKFKRARKAHLQPELDEDLAIETAQEEEAEREEPPVIRQEPETVKEEDAFDIQAKEKSVKELLERGIDFLKHNKPSQAFNEFTHTQNFVKGELYLFVFTDKGVCLAHGDQPDLLWQNLFEARDPFGTPVVQSMIAKAKQGGGWITYQWRNSTHKSFVQEVKKDDVKYIIGCGYYPDSKRDAVISLVKGAVAFFNDIKKEGRSVDEAFSTFNYPKGRFVSGDLYLYALDFKGNIMTQGDRPGLVGTNALNFQADGKYANQEIIEKLKKNPDEGVWVTYVSKRATKQTYAERVVDAKGTNYFIACGYYPDADRSEVVDLVKKGYVYMKQQGKTLAAQDFTSKSNMEFRFGDLNLTVYDMKGRCIASGENEELVGQNLWNSQDEDGRYYVQEIIRKAKKDRYGWVDFKAKNSFESMYVELIDLGIDRYVIGCGTFPISKSETMSLLVKSGASYLRLNTDEKAFEDFTKNNGKFIRGDLVLFVLDEAGLCYAYGDDHEYIWKNLMEEKDDNGKQYFKIMIDTVKQGAGKVTYKLKGNPAVAYVQQVKKADKTYIIGSSFYK